MAGRRRAPGRNPGARAFWGWAERPARARTHFVIVGVVCREGVVVVL